MSRTIEFRVWDKDLAKYLVGCEIDSLMAELSAKDDGRGVIIKQICPARYIFEQYTGLKDKNGKEIYEGDIVNLEYYEKPFDKKRWRKTYPRKGGKDINIVGFEDGFFKFYEEDEDGYGSELAFSDYGEWEGKDGAYKYEAEVVGNIHENPELLGGEE